MHPMFAAYQVHLILREENLPRWFFVFQPRLAVGIEWRDSYRIGHREIDAQHQEWFKKINNFLDASDLESMARCEALMYEYTKVHFAHEEALMRAVFYPEFHEHVMKHREMLAHINAMSAQITIPNWNMSHHA